MSRISYWAEKGNPWKGNPLEWHEKQILLSKLSIWIQFLPVDTLEFSSHSSSTTILAFSVQIVYGSLYIPTLCMFSVVFICLFWPCNEYLILFELSCPCKHPITCNHMYCFILLIFSPACLLRQDSCSTGVFTPCRTYFVLKPLLP